MYDLEERLDEILTRKNWSKAKLATEMGIPRQNLNSLLKNPTKSKMEAMAKALDVPIWELFVSSKEIHANNMVAFFHYNGRSHTPTTIDEIMSILKDWKEDEFHTSCHRHDFQHIREKYAEDGSIQQLMDSLCALLHEDCNNPEISKTTTQDQ